MVIFDVIDLSAAPVYGNGQLLLHRLVFMRDGVSLFPSSLCFLLRKKKFGRVLPMGLSISRNSIGV